MYDGSMGGRAWVVVAAMGAAGCGGGGEDSRGDGVLSTPAMSAGDTSSAGTSSGAGSSSGEPVPTTDGDDTSSSSSPSPSTSTSTTTSSSSSGEADTSSGEPDTGAPACGDGAVDGDEVCDDGNAVDGDGCNVDCQPSGRLLWSDRYGGGSKLADEVLDCAVDKFGSIYVAGFTTVTKPNEDVWARSYAADGAVVWTQTYNGALGAKDRGEAVVVDASQLVFVAGHDNVSLQGNNVWVRKHAADGMPTWTRGYDGPLSGSDAAYAATLTAAGDLVVVGGHTVDGQGMDTWLRKYDAAGTTLWTRTYSGDAGLTDIGRAVTEGAGGILYVAGEEEVVGEDGNMWLGRFDTDGNLLWSRLYSGAASLGDALDGAAATDDGGVVVCGVEKAVTVPSLSFVRKYDDAGLVVWTVSDDGAGGLGASCYEVDIADNGDVLVAGSAVDGVVTRPVVQRMDPSGALRWSTTIPGAGTAASQARCVRPAADGTIVVAGSLDDGVDGRDAWVGRLSP
jgi:cysteine-rich repeat protein